MIASCYLLTPGTPFMYYGEEIMLRGIRGSSDNSDYARRQPMLWGGGEASCNPPEGKSIANQVTVGAKDALNDGWSLLNHEKKVLSIRNKYNDFFRFGVYSALDLGNPWVGGFQITYNGSTKVLIHNSGSEVATLAYPSSGTLLEDINTSKTASSYQKGTLTLQPFSSVLIG
jgi:glycosidase